MKENSQEVGVPPLLHSRIRTGRQAAAESVERRDAARSGGQVDEEQTRVLWQAGVYEQVVRW